MPLLTIDEILEDLAKGECEIRQAKKCIFIALSEMTIDDFRKELNKELEE